MGDSPRITGPTLKVLRELLCCSLYGISGAEIAKAAGLASGTLYPLLFRLERSGWVWSEWEEVDPSKVKRPRRRLYRLTAVGQRSARDVFSDYLPKEGELSQYPKEGEPAWHF